MVHRVVGPRVVARARSGWRFVGGPAVIAGLERRVDPGKFRADQNLHHHLLAVLRRPTAI